MLKKQRRTALWAAHHQNRRRRHLKTDSLGRGGVIEARKTFRPLSFTAVSR
jgi:hypothetical protein